MGYLYHRRVPSVATLTAGKRGKQAQIGKVEHATCHMRHLCTARTTFGGTVRHIGDILRRSSPDPAVASAIWKALVAAKMQATGKDGVAQ